MLAWRKGFYGYTIAASAFVVDLLLGGSYFSLSVLTPVMAGDLGWSAAAFGAAFSMAALLAALVTSLIAAIVMRIGSRLAIVIGSLLIFIALAGLSITTAIWQLYGFFILLGFGLTLGTLLPIQQMIGNWFVRRRSMFLGMVLTGSGFGGLAIAALASGLLIATGSWRVSWGVLAALALIPAPLALFFVKDKPRDLGQKADGSAREQGPEVEGGASSHTGHVYKSQDQWTTKAATRTWTFWLIALAFGATLFLLHGTTAHQVAYLAGEAGVDLTVAASALGLISASSILGRLIAGWLGDRVEPRLIMTGSLFLLGLSILIVLTVGELAGIYLYVILFGIGYGGMIVMAPATVLNYYGAESSAAIVGIVMTVGGILGALSPLLVGSIKDVTGSYVPALVLMMSLAVVGALCAFLAKPPLTRSVE